MATVSGDQASTIGGHPKGLAYLSFTEMWERFSFYGMSALLTLYMVKQLLLPGHTEHVLGLGALRNLFEFRGPMSNLAFASLIYGWYAGLVYFTPILGGWIADRLLGAKRTVMLGAVLMSAGHLAMSFDQSFLIALLLLILGSGCLKGNISAQVGTLYPREASSLRDRGFAIFSIGINIGAASGPLIAGSLAAAYGWHAGFALAAALMLLALAIYLAGQRHLPDTKPTKKQRAAAVKLTAEERRRVWALLAIVALTIPAEIAYPMIWSVGIVWVDQQVTLGTQFGVIPSTWFGSIDSIGAIIAAPALVALWASQAKKLREPNSVTKIAIGTGLVSVAALIFAASNLTAEGRGSIAVGWALSGYLLMGLAWMYYWPTLLALISRAAPPAVASTLMGAAFLSPFIGHTLMGWIGSFYDQMTPAAFWTMDAGIALAGAILLGVVRGPLSKALDVDHKPT